MLSGSNLLDTSRPQPGWIVSLAQGLLIVLLAPVVAFCLAPPISTNLKPTSPRDPAGVQFFEQKIRPMLVQHCFECHSSAAKKSRGGLRVDTRAALREGGDSGPALVPGKPEDSLLIKALRHDEVAMPPKSKLPETVISDFVRWIDMGAPDPRDGLVAPQRQGLDLEAGRTFWAFQPPRHHPAPEVRDGNWARTDIDRFLLARLEAKGMRPAPDADRVTLLRRVTLDLTGLPPTLEEIDAFVSDRSADAWSRVVDRLLASPAFGERWGRHWLDLARYADSNGKDENFTFHDAWRYRDHVIASFNADKPFDRFLAEQLAGDLLPAASQTQRDEQLTATGFLVIGPKMLFDRDKLKQKMDVVDEQIDTVGRALLGLTLGCARCHDHKFDPIPTKDYYALAGIFASTRTLDGTKLGNPLISGWMVRPLEADGEKMHSAVVAHQKKREAITAELQKARVEQKVIEAQSDLARKEMARQRIQQLMARAARLEALTLPAPELVLAVRDEDSPGDVSVNVRGNPHVVGDRVARGFLTVASKSAKPALAAGSSGRRELAEWVASPKNPLTARVFVNRVWMHLFGNGLVRTVDDFGTQGARPTHPELLDELAVRFVQEGWSVKDLVRSLVLGRAYQIAVTRESSSADPENHLLSRANRRRLQAEVIRDAMLSVSGQLDRVMGGSAVVGLGDYATTNNAKETKPTDPSPRRSLYLPVIRNNLPAIFEVFDFADPDVATGKRDTTIVPTQALYLMNSPFVMEQASQTALRLLTSAATDADRLRLLYRLALSRVPTPVEVENTLRFLHQQAISGASEREAWAAVSQALFGSTEFRFVE